MINHFSKMLLKCYLFAISKGNEDHRTERTHCSAIFGHEIFAETGIVFFIVVEKGKIEIPIRSEWIDFFSLSPTIRV